MNDIAGEVVQQLQAMQADDDALLALEIRANYRAALRCQHHCGQKIYVVTAVRNGKFSEKDKELCFRADEAHAAIRYLIVLAASWSNHAKLNISFFYKDAKKEQQLFQVNAQPGEKDIVAISRLLPIIESARRLTGA
ncbi:hypothetical protein PPROV_000398500 [Pycnococcus provasolii]|uniref:Uncharacterized protein n=1 Tax=Pycnococcus provasolii TaxID=41880 RepID=A0A830HFG5_9CHLO|nr:hypothetical protein PPROV_000398500 [Pycnococcus provasolii]